MAKPQSRVGVTVVITGASSGFGKGIAKRLAEQGANVVLAARRTELIEELAHELAPNALAVTTDVSKEDEVRKLFEAAVLRFGKVDVWINNAAVGLIGTYTDVPPEDMRRVTEINVFGTLYGSYYAMQHFVERGSGTLINMGSVSAKVAFPYYTPYGTTKFAVTGLTESLHAEMEIEGHKNIHVCLVHPWATDTPWFLHTANYTGHMAQMKPMDDPEIVIDAVVDLLDNPKASVEVGIKTKATSTSSTILPNVTEKMNAKQAQRVIRQAPPQEPTTGSLYEPLDIGTGISGGIRKRMEQE